MSSTSFVIQDIKVMVIQPMNTHPTSSYQEKDQAHFTRWAPLYDARISGYFFRRSYQRILHTISPRPHQRILDLGCGTGGFINALLAAEPTLSITGVDYTEAMLNQARKKFHDNDRVSILREPAEQLSIPSQSIDLLYCLDVFHHFADPDAVLEQMRRVLRSNGRMIILDPINDGWRKPLIDIATPLLGEEHIRVYSLKEWQEMFRHHAMRIEYNHSWLLFFNIFVLSFYEPQ